MVIMSDMITRLEYIMNTENPTSEENQLQERLFQILDLEMLYSQNLLGLL